MRKLLFVALAVYFLLTALAIAAMADIPGMVDYWARYRKIDSVPTWEYIPGYAEYGLPTWGYDDDSYWWHVGNYALPNYEKRVYFEIDWMPGYAPINPIDLYLLPAEGSYEIVTPVYNPANYSWTHYFLCVCQPGWENVYWARDNMQYYYWLHDLQNIYRIEVGTMCTLVPEPASMAALLVGIACLARLSRRRA